MKKFTRCKHGMIKEWCGSCKFPRREIKGDPDQIPSLAVRMEQLKVTSKDYIQALFDDSDYGDGVGFEAMASHTKDKMSGTVGGSKYLTERSIGGFLDRMISESGYMGSAVSYPRIVHSDGRVIWQRPEWLARKLKCDLQSADKLIKAWKNMGATTKMAFKFVRWLQPSVEWIKHSKGGSWLGQFREDKIANGLVWFSRIADALDQVTVEKDEYIISTVEDAAQKAVNEGKAETLFNLNDHDPRGEYPTATFTYIPIGISERDLVTPWIERQSEMFRDYMVMLTLCRTTKELARFSQTIYKMTEKKKFSNDQASVLFGTHKIMKKKLDIRLRSSVKFAVKYLTVGHDPIGQKGKWLYNFLADNDISYEKRCRLWKIYKIMKSRSNGMPGHYDQIPIDYDYAMYQEEMP